MKSLNHIYKDIATLVEFVESSSFSPYQSVLIQIFSGLIDEKKALQISTLLKLIIPNATVIGTTTAGEIVNAKMHEKNILINFLCFNSSSVNSTFIDFDKEYTLQEKFDRVINSSTKALIIFSDGLKSNAEVLLQEINQYNKGLIIAGGRAADFMHFEKTFVFDDKATTQNGCVIASLSGEELIVNNEYMLNWNGVGKIMHVTKAHENRLFEVDGKKIIDIYRKYLGDDIADNLPLTGNEFPLLIQRNSTQVARVPIAKLEDDSLLYGGFIEEGDRVQFSFGNIEQIKNSASQQFEELKDISCEAICIYSCSARKTLMGKELEAEFQILESLAPTAGFFTFGEYFHKQDKIELLNVTTTFLSLSETPYTSEHVYQNEPFSNNNRVLNAMSHLMAVTTKELEKETQEVQKALQIKSDFLANMSHEIRTPLNSILGFVDIVQANEKNKENKEYLSIVQKSGNNLLGIINDILDISKMDSNKLELETIEVNPHEEFSHILKLFSRKTKEKNITLESHICPRMPQCIFIDPLRITQVISNLLSNAIKFTPENGKIILKTKYQKRSGKLFVSVKDSGIGIAKENQEHIFDAFTQADSSTTRKYGGTGLGLAISYKLIELMGGELKLKSDLNQGADFYFEIELKKCKNVKDSSQQSSIMSKQITSTLLKKKKILLVEDNRANQMFMQVLFKQLHVEIDIANNGVEAVEKFQKNRYDIVLMDENMPLMNGIIATQKIIEYEKENMLAHTPIVALTANAIDGDRDRFIKAGMDEYLTKPLKKEKLFEVLSQFLAI